MCCLLQGEPLVKSWVGEVYLLLNGISHNSARRICCPVTRSEPWRLQGGLGRLSCHPWPCPSVREGAPLPEAPRLQGECWELLEEVPHPDWGCGTGHQMASCPKDSRSTALKPLLLREVTEFPQQGIMKYPAS